MKILLLGATGLVGQNILEQALTHSAITYVVAPTRQSLPAHRKLVNPVSDHLESLLDTAKGVDGVICALGTTISKAGSEEAFRKVDHALPLAFARSAHEHGAATFCSSFGERCFHRFFDVLSPHQRRDRAGY